jgi:hypothetical protein
VVLGESFVLIVTGAFGPPGALGVPGAFDPPAELGMFGEFGVLGGLSGNLQFLFSGKDLEPFERCYRQCSNLPGEPIQRHRDEHMREISRAAGTQGAARPVAMITYASFCSISLLNKTLSGTYP